jgi:hypothetical protein
MGLCGWNHLCAVVLRMDGALVPVAGGEFVGWDPTVTPVIMGHPWGVLCKALWRTLVDSNG